jgi:hypothetical protein
LKPALQDFNKDVRWEFIKEYCITEDAKVSKERPDFLNRVALPFVLEEYKKSNPEAPQILKQYMLSRGIPEKAELIFQELTTSGFTSDQKWGLAAIAIDRPGINPFIEKIIGELANEGHAGAIEQLEKWSNDPTYYSKPPFFGSYLVQIIKTLLDSAPNVAVSLFENFLASSYFAQESYRIDLREIYELLSGMIARDIDDGWRIWNSLYRNKSLTLNQQVLLTGSLSTLIETENEGARKKAFVTADHITSDYEQFALKFSYPHARQLVVQLIEKCSEKTDFFDPLACLKIVERFINDPDPGNENDPNDATGQFNYHKQILDEKDPGVITSVRGYIPWALQRIVRVGIEDGLDEVIGLTKILNKDKNLYVRLQSCVALTRLAQMRLSQTADGNSFMSEDQTHQIEEAAFQMLNDPENKHVALQVAMAHVFIQMRCIDFGQATEAVSYFIEADFEALQSYLSTIIYFAELSGDFSEEQKLTFRTSLFRLIKRDSPTRSAISWHMWSLSKAKGPDGETYLNKTLKYLREIVDKYDQDAFRSVYAVIKNNLKNSYYQNGLLSIYKKCIETEFEYLNTHPNYPKKVSAPYYRNSEILCTIFSLSKEDFIYIFKMLSRYPRESYIGDITNIVDLLFKMPKSLQNDVRDIFENLVARYPILYEKKKQWEERTKNSRLLAESNGL